MGAKTKIDWCDSTWNPVTGCLHGCEYCYARRIAERFRARKIYDPECQCQRHLIERGIVNMVSQNNTALVWDSVYHQYEGLGLYGGEVTQDIKPESVDTTGLQEKIRKILTNANTDGNGKAGNGTAADRHIPFR